MPRVAVTGGELEFAEYGHGPEVVISAQWAFREGGYQALLGLTLPERFRVFAVTLRGYGNSMPETPNLGDDWYDTWADDVYQCSRAWGFDRFLYTGASHGAGVGWHLALRHPEMMRGLVSVAGAPKDRTSLRSPEELARAIAERQRQPTPLRPDWPQRSLPRAATNEELAALLETIHVPTLLVAGVQDEVISLEDTLRALRAVKASRAVLFEDGKHSIGSEHAMDIVRQIVAFADALAQLPKSTL